MNRKQWKQLWRSVRRGDISTAHLVRHYDMAGAMLAPKGKRTVHRLKTWNAAKALLDMLITHRPTMSKADRRVLIEAVRAM